MEKEQGTESQVAIGDKNTDRAGRSAFLFGAGGATIADRLNQRAIV